VDNLNCQILDLARIRADNLAFTVTRDFWRTCQLLSSSQNFALSCKPILISRFVKSVAPKAKLSVILSPVVSHPIW